MNKLTVDQSLRQEALKLAVTVCVQLKLPIKSDDIMIVAKKFYEFVKGDEDLT